MTTTLEENTEDDEDRIFMMYDGCAVVANGKWSSHQGSYCQSYTCPALAFPSTVFLTTTYSVEYTVINFLAP